MIAVDTHVLVYARGRGPPPRPCFYGPPGSSWSPGQAYPRQLGPRAYRAAPSVVSWPKAPPPRTMETALLLPWRPVRLTRPLTDNSGHAEGERGTPPAPRIAIAHFSLVPGCAGTRHMRGRCAFPIFRGSVSRRGQAGGRTIRRLVWPPGGPFRTGLAVAARATSAAPRPFHPTAPRAAPSSCLSREPIAEPWVV